MNCREIREFVYLYLDNELSADDRFLIDEHLRFCFECREFYEQEKVTLSMIKIALKSNAKEAPFALKQKVLPENEVESKYKTPILKAAVASLFIVFLAVFGTIFFLNNRVTSKPKTKPQPQKITLYQFFGKQNKQNTRFNKLFKQILLVDEINTKYNPDSIIPLRTQNPFVVPTVYTKQ